MAIKKAKVTSNYVTIPNSSAQDKNLSFEARGLLTLMLSMPDDWVMHRSWLMDQSVGCGRDNCGGDTAYVGGCCDAWDL